MGVSGINLQGNPANCVGYTPVCAPTAEALAAGALRRAARVVCAAARQGADRRPPASPRASARARSRPTRSTAFLAPDGTLHFVIVDDDPPGARSRGACACRWGAAFAAPSVLSLTAPSPERRLRGAGWAAEAVAPDGSWSQPPGLPHAPNRNGVITVELKPEQRGAADRLADREERCRLAGGRSHATAVGAARL